MSDSLSCAFFDVTRLMDVLCSGTMEYALTLSRGNEGGQEETLYVRRQAEDGGKQLSKLKENLQ
jgi:hypothetical protein